MACELLPKENGVRKQLVGHQKGAKNPVESVWRWVFTVSPALQF
jgi:hypothetical protein